MDRRIVGFHADDEGDWVAELGCGHRQHVRHRPPFQVRPWVVDAEGRAGRVGTSLPCVPCDRAELPDGLVEVGRRGPWSAADVPRALRRGHQTPGGCWGLLRVLAGGATVVFLAARGEGRSEAILSSRVLEPGAVQPLPPGRWHRVDPEDGAELELVLLAPSPATEGGDDG